MARKIIIKKIKKKGVILDFCAENPMGIIRKSSPIWMFEYKARSENPMGIIRKSSPICMFEYKARSTEDVFQWIGELIRKQHRGIFYYP